jgi:hypothetical protein
MIDLPRELTVLATTDAKTYVAYVRAVDRMWVAYRLAQREHKRVSEKLLKELRRAHSL